MPKTITMAMGLTTFTATISSNMSEGETIYNTLRAAFDSILHPGAHIVVYQPTGNEKVRLSYTTLKQGVTYRVEPAAERLQGAATSSAGTLRTRVDVEQILQNWGLEDPSQILPASIAPPNDPYSWARRMTHALRGMSGKHQCSHQTALWYLEQEVAARQERGDDGVYHLTAGDVSRATKKMVEFMAQEATDIVEDGEANAVFVGGLAEAVEEAAQECEGEGEEEEGAGAGAGEGAAGWQYQAAGQFQIATHFRK
jgi:hypothetical protein